MLIGLLAASAASFAESPRCACTCCGRGEARSRGSKTRAKLEDARARLDKACAEVAELSNQLGASARA